MLNSIAIKAQEDSLKTTSEPNLNEAAISTFMAELDSLFLAAEYEGFSKKMKNAMLECEPCGVFLLDYLEQYTDTLIVSTNSAIDSNSFVVARENIFILDELNYYFSENKINWRFSNSDVSNLKCSFNSSLTRSFTSDIQRAYKFYKSSASLNKAGDLAANAQYFRLKFYRDVCFESDLINREILKLDEVLKWIEKSSIDQHYQKITDDQPEWVKLGLSYEEYQERWAQKLSVGSDYMGGACSNCGKSLYKGKRGGTYYINGKGNKQYVPKK
jgi:hypothetical protein